MLSGLITRAESQRPPPGFPGAPRRAGTIRARSLPTRTALIDDDCPDAELIDRCQQGQKLAWATLVRRYQRLIYTVAMRAGLAEDQAAEIFQATFVRLNEHLHRLREPERLRAWLVTTAKRETLLLRERMARHMPLQGDDGEATAAGLALSEVPDADPLPEEQLSQMQQAQRLQRALARLDGRSQLWAELLFLQDEPLPYGEIAERMQVAIGSIGPTRARLLEKLRKILSEDL
jgi:RNA polymerase sigma factor (sigma-70 family)